MPSTQNNALVVNLESIRVFPENAIKPGSTWAQAQPLPYRIDSVLSQMWLPLEVCLIFERELGISWNETLELYLLDNSTRTSLMQQNYSVGFTLSGQNGAKPQTFVLPYSAFDLQVEPPLVEKTTYYFPLKRVINSTQYMLGRVFLQEVYLTVDYECHNFSLSQLYPLGGSGRILPISQVQNETALDANTKASSLTLGANVGIGIGIGLLVLVLIGLLVSWKKGWGFFRKKPSGPDLIEKPELHGEAIPRSEAMESERAELPVKCAVEAMERDPAELETRESSQEVGSPMSPTVEGLSAQMNLMRSKCRGQQAC
jgi:hypothetical protein